MYRSFVAALLLVLAGLTQAQTGSQAGNWIKETVQQWTDRSGSLALADTVVSRQRILTYYGPE